MKIILKDKEAEAYVLYRQMGELKNCVNELRKMHDGLRTCNRFDLTDICNKINNILDDITFHGICCKLAELNMSTPNELSD